MQVVAGVYVCDAEAEVGIHLCVGACACVRVCVCVCAEATGQPQRNSTNCDHWVLPEGLFWLISLANLLCVVPLALSVRAPRSSSTTSGIHPPKTPTYTPCLLPRAQCRLLSPGLCCWKGPASGLHWQRRLIPQPHTHTSMGIHAHTPCPRSNIPSWILFKCTETHTHSSLNQNQKQRVSAHPILPPPIHPPSSCPHFSRLWTTPSLPPHFPSIPPPPSPTPPHFK